MQIPRTIWPKVSSEPIIFYFFKIIIEQPLRKYNKNFNSLLCGTFVLYPTSKGHQVERLAFQGQAKALGSWEVFSSASPFRSKVITVLVFF